MDGKFPFEFYSIIYLTSECSERIRYQVEYEKVKFVSTSTIKEILAISSISDDTNISDHFLKFYEDV